jgi:hypothetical protein
MVLVSFLLAIPLLFAEDKKAPVPTPKELAAISARGKALYEYDQAAWHASDALESINPPTGRLGRFIARKDAQGWVVGFGHLSPDHKSFLLAYEVRQKDPQGHFTVFTFEPVKEDSGFYLGAANAIETVLADFRGEPRQYNLAVLPADAGQLYLYVYPAQTKKDVIPLGGDVRYLVSADGLKIITKRQLHKGILEPQPGPPGTTTVGGTHSHILSDVPEDTDVFHALAQKMPEYVGAGGHVFDIEPDGQIRVTK